MVWTLHPNGSVTSELVTNTDERYRFYFPWRWDGERFVTGREPPSWAQGIVREIQIRMIRYLHTSYICMEESSTASFRSADEIILKSVDDPKDVMTLSRIEE